MTVKRRWMKFGLMFASAVALAGCSSTGGTGEGSGGGVGAAFSGVVSQVSGDSNGPAFAQLRAEQSAGALGFAATPSRASIETADARLTALRAPSMERYMQSIGQRLMRHWHGANPERIGFFVTPDEATSAYALPSGDVLVSIRYIQSMETEDELAALLAHEMAHVLLKHHENERTVKSLARVGSMAAAAVATIAVAERMESERTANGFRVFLPSSQSNAAGRDVLQTMAAFQGALEIATALGVSAYNRAQEHQADQFAVEMLHYAGYDPTALQRVLERMRTIEQEQLKRRQAYEIQARDIGGIVNELFTLTITEFARVLNRSHPDTGARIGRVGKHYGSLVGDNGEIVTPSVGGLRAARSAGDFSALAGFYTRLNAVLNEQPSNDRNNRLRALLNSGYGQTAIARTMAYPAINSFDSDAAYAMLRGATNTGAAPLSYYALLSKDHALRGNNSGARSAISAMADTYGWDVAYPSGVKVARMLEDADWMNSLLARCRANAPSDVQKECNAASQGLAADDDFRQMPTFISDFANAARDMMMYAPD